jgi:hypothetical protein
MSPGLQKQKELKRKTMAQDLKAFKRKTMAKLFQFPDGATQVFHGCVRLFTVDDDGGLYSIRYDDGDTEDMDCDEFCAGHELATTSNSTSDDTIADKTAAFRKKLSSALENLTDIYDSTFG